MAEHDENVLDEVFEGVGLVAGLAVGLAAGTVGAAAKLVTGESLDNAGETFGDVALKCVEEGAKVGRKYGFGIVSFAASILLGAQHRNQSGGNG